MAKTTIPWTHYTFNPWWGCTKVSAGCKFCYAESTTKRWAGNLWGDNADRRFFSDKHWKAPISWNAEAQRLNRRYRVFSASMADVFESRADLVKPRYRLFKLIEDTPYLDWLLLTKRPENWKSLLPAYWFNAFPANVWLGMTTETQDEYDNRIGNFYDIPTSVIRFLSIEPQLSSMIVYQKHQALVDWVIIGGESGQAARPILPASIRPSTIADSIGNTMIMLNELNIPVFFKQTGTVLARQLSLKSFKGEDFSEYPPVLDNLKIRQFPNRKLKGLTNYEYAD